MISSYFYLVAFVLLWSGVTGRKIPSNFSSPIEYYDSCQEVTDESDYPPKEADVVLKRSFLKPFKEIMVIGDIHGCLDELQLLLNKSEANNDKVLKLFTGDLTRGGPKNREVLQFMRDCKSCLSVRGNNDEITLITYNTYKVNGTLKKVDKWMKDMTDEDIEYLTSLPYTISLPTLNSVLVHGGFLPGGVPMKYNRPYTLMNIRDVLPEKQCPGGWRPTRDEFVSFAWASKWSGPQHIYFGHDHKRQLQLYPFATGVDTSCCRGHYMTGVFIYGPRKGIFKSQAALAQYYHGKV